MVNGLFAHGHPGLAAELTVCFRLSVCMGRVIIVRAWNERCSLPLHMLKAEIVQNGQIKATAYGKFVDQA